MSGAIDIVSGYTFNNEAITLAKLNAMVADMIATVGAGAITTRELAAGVITADKLDVALTTQLGIPDGTITVGKLVDGVLENSTTGRLKMAAGFLSADAVGRSKMANDFLGADNTSRALMADGFLSADATGRAKMADAFVTAAKMAALSRINPVADVLAMHAYTAIAQMIEVNAATAIVCELEAYDYGACHSVSTGKYTPTIAGIYLVISRICINGATGGTVKAGLLKNGATLSWGTPCGDVTGQSTSIDIVAMNGSTDYLQLAGVSTNLTVRFPLLISGTTLNSLQAVLLAKT